MQGMDDLICLPELRWLNDWKELHGDMLQKIILPIHQKDYPDRDRLDQRIERFLKVQA
jgi:hypothetical protein